MSIEKIIIPSALVILGGGNYQNNISLQNNSIIQNNNIIVETGKKIPIKEIREKVYNIISESLGIPVSEISDKSNFRDDFGTDSLDIVEIIMSFEKEFNILIIDDLAEKIETVEDVINIIYDLTNNSVIFYSDKDFSGKQLLLNDNYSPYFYSKQKKQIIENGLSSIIVPKGYIVYLYNDEEFTGDYIKIDAQNNEIKIKDFENIKTSKYIYVKDEKINWNDAIISTKIEKK